MKSVASLLLSCLVLSAGCGQESMDKAKRATNKAGQVVGEGASSFFTGIGAGIDKTVTSYEVRLSDELKKAGVSVTVAKHIEGVASNNWRQALSFYVLNKAPVSGVLRLRLFNDKGQEIGRSIAPVAFGADDARYVPFYLDKEIPLALTRYVEMDLKKD